MHMSCMYMYIYRAAIHVTYTHRDAAIRSVIEAAYTLTTYIDLESILDIVCPMASDHG